jgi:hypothetical protein
MDSATLVGQAIDAILALEHAGRLVGSSIRVPGAERTMLVSAIRSQLGATLDDCQIYSLADFIPLAFARVAATDKQVQFPNYFGRKDSRGRIREYRRLDDEIMYREAVTIAQAWRRDRPNDVPLIAEWSGLPELIRTAIANGSKLQDLELIPPLLDGPDEACPPLSERPTFPDQPWWLKHWIPRPWWKFW